MLCTQQHEPVAHSWVDQLCRPISVIVITTAWQLVSTHLHLVKVVLVGSIRLSMHNTHVEVPGLPTERAGHKHSLHRGSRSRGFGQMPCGRLFEAGECCFCVTIRVNTPLEPADRHENPTMQPGHAAEECRVPIDTCMPKRCTPPATPFATLGSFMGWSRLWPEPCSGTSNSHPNARTHQP
jgi:hypothetical protein